MHIISHSLTKITFPKISISNISLLIIFFNTHIKLKIKIPIKDQFWIFTLIFFYIKGYHTFTFRIISINLPRWNILLNILSNRYFLWLLVNRHRHSSFFLFIIIFIHLIYRLSIFILIGHYLSPLCAQIDRLGLWASFALIFDIWSLFLLFIFL